MSRLATVAPKALPTFERLSQRAYDALIEAVRHRAALRDAEERLREARADLDRFMAERARGRRGAVR